MFAHVVNHLSHGLELWCAFELESELVLHGETEEQDGEGVEADIADELRILGHGRQIHGGLDENQDFFQFFKNSFSFHYFIDYVKLSERQYV